jgi:peptide/nickel transport system substrate-binding protein
MHDNKNIRKLANWYSEGKLSRRDFLRDSTLLGLSTTAAFSIVGMAAPSPARAQNLPQGGTLRMALRVLDVSNPHAITFDEGGTAVRPVCDYLVRTGQDNITRPWLLEGWEASEDLLTWTLKVRDGVKWHNGRTFTSEDVAWNIRHALAPETGSSIVGLMGDYMLSKVETGENDDDGKPVMLSELWDSNAVEIVDPLTLRLNVKTPQVSIPEHLFHFPFFMLDPEEDGVFGVGSNGTGGYRMVEHVIGERSVLERVEGDWFMPGANLARIEVTDFGEDSNAAFGALVTDQVDGIYELSENLAPMVEAAEDVVIYRQTTALTAVVRGKMNQPPFDNPLVMKAVRAATNGENVVERALRGRADIGDHSHVSPIHPEWKDLGPYPQDIEGARAILAEAGYPDGIDLKFSVKTQPAWELDAAQVMVEDWAKAGIRATIQTMPASVFWDQWTDFPFSLTAWGHRPLAPMVLSLAYRTDAPWNESSFSNAEFDDLLTQVNGTIDPDARIEITGKLMEIMRESGPISQAFFMQVSTAYNARVKGFEMHPTKFIFFDEMAVET